MRARKVVQVLPDVAGRAFEMKFRVHELVPGCFVTSTTATMDGEEVFERISTHETVAEAKRAHGRFIDRLMAHLR